ncbi:CGNR zinc finger domain-containing protein [Cytophagaceae bacterium YF14B1]|uniref:CGNR zinc finger domain-containing protein n=1 Tax=Xanthocytophaga flava TaxID=3048013 RepID=A0AAE3QWD8_9BACT|nr:CGNR zinc finger domain-containing protein [Xanthocytophaga flavus]MDJ1486246.1 CGNR zinc finger domain-containing protein [Xanthocytophaga flavus]
MVKNNLTDEIILCGGSLCLDFVNTVSTWTEESKKDYVETLNDLAHWCLRTDIIERKEYKRLSARAETDEANLFLEEVKAFRQALYTLLSRRSNHKKISSSHVSFLNTMLQNYMPYIVLESYPDVIKREWKFPKADFRILLAPIVYDAYELLLKNESDKLKSCPKCGWLFIDTTKNGKRKWCSMQMCGSSVKALEWYHRNK